MYRAILIDDDIWSLADMSRSIPFTATGFELVSEFRSAEEALPYILNVRPELIVTDICMGAQDGLDLIRTCRERQVDSLFVIVSGYGRFDYAQRAVSLGAFAYLLKPIDDAEALDALQRGYVALTDRSRASVVDEKGDTFDQMMRYVREHATEQPSLHELSERFHLNRTYVSELFRRRTGRTYTRYRNELCVKAACELLSNRPLSVEEVSAGSGFEDARYFARIFKEMTGVTPQQYRKHNRRATI